MPEASHYVVTVDIKKVTTRTLNASDRGPAREVEDAVHVVTKSEGGGSEANKIDAINKAIAFLVVERGAGEGR